MSYRFDSLFNDVRIVSEDREHYVYSEPGSSYGFDLDLNKSPDIRRVSMDSLRRIEWTFQIDVYKIFKAKTALVWTKKDKGTGTLQEVYNFTALEDTSLNGTCELTFTNKIKNIDYSLCRELDSLKKMKLQEIRIVENARYFKAANIYLEKPRRSIRLRKLTRQIQNKYRHILRCSEKTKKLPTYELNNFRCRFT